MKLKGKAAIITGATGGIGQALVKRFIEEGCQVAIADINEQAVAAFSQAMNNQHQGSTIPLVMDVSNEQKVNSAFTTCIEQLGKIDILISNAGIQHLSAFDQFPYEEWQRIIKVNLDGCFLTAKKAFEQMKKQTGGAILFTGSLRSVEGGSLNSAYVASKHAVLGLNRVIATEGAAYNIRSNVICPDYILTPMVEKQITQYMNERKMTRDQVIREILLPQTVDGKFTTVEDIAEAAVFFASFPSAALTGQSMMLSHGWHMS